MFKSMNLFWKYYDINFMSTVDCDIKFFASIEDIIKFRLFVHIQVCLYIISIAHSNQV